MEESFSLFGNNEEEELGRGTYDLGLDSQICLLGGCLLITYVPCEPQRRFNTPDWQSGDNVSHKEKTTQWCSEAREADTYGAFDIPFVSVVSDVFEQSFKVFRQRV